MHALDDGTLLREYATNKSEPAFEALVSRYVHLVHSAAIRQVRDPHLAEEVTQAVFIILAQKAGRIGGAAILSGWLFKTTRFVAIAQKRGAARRRQYEQEASMQSEVQLDAPSALWEEISPLLDEALTKLSEKDRRAVLLRYFENKNLAEIGRAFGTGEDAARMRIKRALEKLRRFFTKRGVTLTAAAFAEAVSADSVQAAPVALAKCVTAVAIARGSIAAASTLTLVEGTLKMITWMKVRTAIGVTAGLMLAGGIAAVTVSTLSRAQETPEKGMDGLTAFTAFAAASQSNFLSLHSYFMRGTLIYRHSDNYPQNNDVPKVVHEDFTIWAKGDQLKEVITPIGDAEATRNYSPETYYLNPNQVVVVTPDDARVFKHGTPYTGLLNVCPAFLDYCFLNGSQESDIPALLPSDLSSPEKWKNAIQNLKSAEFQNDGTLRAAWSKPEGSCSVDLIASAGSKSGYRMKSMSFLSSDGATARIVEPVDVIQDKGLGDVERTFRMDLWPGNLLRDGGKGDPPVTVELNINEMQLDPWIDGAMLTFDWASVTRVWDGKKKAYIYEN